MSFSDDVRAVRPDSSGSSIPVSESVLVKSSDAETKRIISLAETISNEIKGTIMNIAKNTPKDGSALHIKSHAHLWRRGKIFDEFIGTRHERKHYDLIFWDYSIETTDLYLKPIAESTLARVRELLITDNIDVSGFGLLFEELKYDNAAASFGPVSFPLRIVRKEKSDFHTTRKSCTINGIECSDRLISDIYAHFVVLFTFNE